MRFDLASRADVAYVTRLIGKSLYEAIGHLRRIRNAVAHRPDSFRLEDHKDRVRKVLDLGPNVHVGINRFALDLLMRSAIDTLMTLEMPTGEPGRPMFQDPGEVVDYLNKNRHHLEPLNARLLHWELAVGAVFICALIIHERDAATKLLGPRDRLARLCTGDGGEGSPTEST